MPATVDGMRTTNEALLDPMWWDVYEPKCNTQGLTIVRYYHLD